MEPPVSASDVAAAQPPVDAPVHVEAAEVDLIELAEALMGTPKSGS